MQIAPVPSATFTRRPGSVTPPLTHHEILRLIAPFTRRGHHADLGASDRSERRLAFKPIEHEAESPALTGLCETLQLENPRSETYRLIRTLTLRSGLTATLRIDGTDPAELLAGIETVSPPRQFVAVAGHLIAKSYRLETTTHKPRNDAPALRMLLISAEARVDGLTLLLKAETGKGYPAEITLRPVADGTLDLPDDLLAALGWDWGVLRPRGKEWMAMLKAPGREPRRSRRIELRLEQTVAHLVRTLAEPPRRFHERLTGARWAVVFRRTIPLLFCVGLIAGTAGLTLLKIPTDSMFQMLIFNLPPLLLIVLFGMREVPRLEIPPLPRPSTSTAWQPAAHAGSRMEPGAAPTPDVRAG